MTRANRNILKIEAASVFFGALYFYNQTGYSWWLFLLFLLVDLSMVGYLFDKKIGSYTYNLGHSYVVPILMLIFSVESSETLLLVISLMWVGHIGFDRAQGYGLKEERGFKHTHLGRLSLGKKK